MQRVEPSVERGSRSIGRSTAAPMTLLAHGLGLEVEHPFAEAGVGRRTAVVDDVRRQDRDHRGERAALAAIEVVADRAVVDEEQRPGVVGVRRVRVVAERRVEDLADARDARMPRPDVDGAGGRGPSQECTRPSGSRPHSVPAMDGAWLAAIVAFSVVSSVTPGPEQSPALGVRRRVRLRRGRCPTSSGRRWAWG